MDATYRRILQLTLVGTFFNFCLLGSTGDIVKARYAAKRFGDRTDAVMTDLPHPHWRPSVVQRSGINII